LPDDQKSTISKYLLEDAREHPDITVRFKHSVVVDDNNKEGSLELVIQQRLATANLQKFVYTGTLQATRRTTTNTMSNKQSSSILQFCNTLGNAINESRRQIQSLQQDIRSKQQSIDHWKDTAQQLGTQVWQKEKDQLVHNFLKLWNERQARAKKQFQELQEELELTKAALTSKTNERKRGRALKLDETEVGEDDLAAPSEPIPLDQVAALAAGRRLNSAKPSRPAILKQEETVSAATLMEQAKEYDKRKHLPPPSKEERGDSSDIDDGIAAKDDFKEEEEDEEKPAKKARRKAPPSKSSKQPQSSKKSAKKKASPSPASSPSLGRDSPDSVEEALRAQIRARIQKDISFSDDEDDKKKDKSAASAGAADWDLSF